MKQIRKWQWRIGLSACAILAGLVFNDCSNVPAGGDKDWDVMPPSIAESIYYGHTSPDLYTGLTTAQQNAIVAVCSIYGCHCSGTIISPHVVLTAGHCVDLDEFDYTADIAEVHVGADNSSGYHAIYVQELNHKGYLASNFNDYLDDVGVLILDSTYSSVTPLPVRTDSVDAIVGHNAQSVGFGMTQNDTQNNPNTQRHWTTMAVSYIDGDNYNVVVDGGGDTGVAPGDSGSPLLYDFGGGVQVSGVASTSVEGWVYNANYCSVIYNESWIADYVNQYDRPECITACQGVECGTVGACPCGGCNVGYQCSGNTCQEITAGTGGICVGQDYPTSPECSIANPACSASGELCVPWDGQNWEPVIRPAPAKARLAPPATTAAAIVSTWTGKAASIALAPAALW
jgi:V8-like Glu-specific endopeptidase